LLPDGRIQVVTYQADENGYNAAVNYEGEARYDEQKPYAPAPSSKKPSYPAQPAYNPSYQAESYDH
jgi:hypothetical protein